jgi:hypothetical protein
MEAITDEHYLVECKALYFGKIALTFLKKELPLSSGSKSKSSKNPVRNNLRS